MREAGCALNDSIYPCPGIHPTIRISIQNNHTSIQPFIHHPSIHSSSSFSLLSDAQFLSQQPSHLNRRRNHSLDRKRLRICALARNHASALSTACERGWGGEGREWREEGGE